MDTLQGGVAGGTTTTLAQSPPQAVNREPAPAVTVRLTLVVAARPVSLQSLLTVAPMIPQEIPGPAITPSPRPVFMTRKSAAATTHGKQMHKVAESIVQRAQRGFVRLRVAVIRSGFIL